MPAPFALLVKTRHATFVALMEPGDTLQVAAPNPEGTAASLLATFEWDGMGIDVAVHHRKE